MLVAHPSAAVVGSRGPCRKTEGVGVEALSEDTTGMAVSCVSCEVKLG